MTVKSIEYPFTEDKIRALKAGDLVEVSGLVYTGRDRFHKYLHEGGQSPCVLKDGALYHCGPIVLGREGSWTVRAAGPTTSIREEPYMAEIVRKHNVRVIVGKGGMGESTAKACAECGCVYLQATGGAAASIASKIVSVSGVSMLREFGPAEAVWELVFQGMPAVVAIDARGRSLHKKVMTASKRELRKLLQ